MATLLRSFSRGRRCMVPLFVIAIGAWGLALAGQEAKSPDATKPDVIRPGDWLSIEAVGTLPDAPIQDVYHVEASGKVPLGPAYGRVQIEGKTLEQAEKVVADHLAQLLREVKVQITRYDPAIPPACSAIEALERRVDKLEKEIRRMQTSLRSVRN